MTNKAPFCAFLWLSITVLIRLITSMISVNPVIMYISSSCPSCASWLKNPFNQRNPLSMNDLRLRKITYEIINLFLQNEPNFKKVKLSITIEMKKDYEQMDTWSIRKNEPKTNPNEPKTNPILANKTPVRTQFKPKQTQFRMILAYLSSRAKKCRTMLNARIQSMISLSIGIFLSCSRNGLVARVLMSHLDINLKYCC